MASKGAHSMPTKTAEDYLAALADELAISDTRYEQANKSYALLGERLHRPASKVLQFDPEIYVQGRSDWALRSDRSPKKKSTTSIPSASFAFSAPAT